jgi:hypothetical protein
MHKGTAEQSPPKAPEEVNPEAEGAAVEPAAAQPEVVVAVEATDDQSTAVDGHWETVSETPRRTSRAAEYRKIGPTRLDLARRSRPGSERLANSLHAAVNRTNDPEEHL